MALKITRCAENPIVWPGKWDWRMSNAYNPGALYEDGKFFLYERAAGSLRPHYCSIGLLESADGVHFQHVSDKPVLTPQMLGYPHGSVQDPRVVKIDGVYYMTFAFRRFAWNISPTGVGVPDAEQGAFPGFDPATDKNQTRSGIAVSKDRVQWEFLGWATPPDLDDRDVILFPEKIGGRFALLRRPIGFVATDTCHGEEHPSIRISYSEDLKQWTDPEVVIRPEFGWEDNRIGGSAPPVRTAHGWLTLYHGVQTVDAPTRRVIYRLGAALLDLVDPGDREGTGFHHGTRGLLREVRPVHSECDLPDRNRREGRAAVDLLRVLRYGDRPGDRAAGGTAGIHINNRTGATSSRADKAFLEKDK
jgi:predicted GH43/DUF377 family glycosyl hydrolase